jgi:four helix bundle protein
MDRQDLRHRTKSFALRIIKLYTSLSKSTEAQVIGHQVLRSGTSVGAHYHEACRAKSSADFISKLEGGLQELEENIYWLDLIVEADILAQERLAPLRDEAEGINSHVRNYGQKRQG